MKKSTPKIKYLLAALISAIALTGCGGGSSSTTPAPEPTPTVTPTPTPVPNNTLNFSTQVKGITQTIYSNQSYNAEFTFTNNTGSAVTLANTVISQSGTPLDITLDTTPCSNVQLQANESCTITGNGINLPTHQIAQLSFLLTSADAGAESYTYTIRIAAVAYHAGYAAFRVLNDENPTKQGWLVALGKTSTAQAVVKFDTNRNGSLLDPTSSYAEGQIEIPNTPLGLVIYQPNYNSPGSGIGGLMYVSLESPVYEPHGTEGINLNNTSDPNQNIVFSVYEPNVYDSGTGSLLANLDVTAINFYGVMQGFYALDINTGINKNPGFLVESYSGTATETIFSAVQSNLTTNWPNTWGVESQFVFYPPSSNSWVRLYGLVNWIALNPSVYPAGFESTIYNQYVDDLWTYYAQSTGNKILIDANEISKGCELEAYVDNTNNMLVQPVNSESCPENDGKGANTWSWTKFQPVDFVGGAPDSSSTLWGANGTYKSLGKYISAAQSVGFLPYCSQPDIVYGPPSFSTSLQPNYWTAQYTCLDNYSQYGGTVMNQYDQVLHQYVPSIYAWAYDDALGISSEVDIDPTKFGFTLVIQKFSN